MEMGTVRVRLAEAAEGISDSRAARERATPATMGENVPLLGNAVRMRINQV
jgi:hypothetical protein